MVSTIFIKESRNLVLEAPKNNTVETSQSQLIWVKKNQEYILKSLKN